MGTLGRSGSRVETHLWGLESRRNAGPGRGVQGRRGVHLPGSLALDAQPGCGRAKASPAVATRWRCRIAGRPRDNTRAWDVGRLPARRYGYPSPSTPHPSTGHLSTPTPRTPHLEPHTGHPPSDTGHLVPQHLAPHTSASRTLHPVGAAPHIPAPGSGPNTPATPATGIPHPAS